MGLMYLLTIDFSQHYWSADAVGVAAWLIAATIACQLGMLTKEMMVSAGNSAVVRTHVIAGIVHARMAGIVALYLGLASAWISLAIWNLQGPRTEAGGFHVGIPVLDWWFIQAKVIFTVPKTDNLAVALGGALTRCPTRHIGEAWPWVLGVTAMIIGVAAMISRTAWGFAGCWFFAILSPTLLVPIATEIAAERRMYMPLAALVP